MMGDKGVSYLVKNSSLRELDISLNEITHKGFSEVIAVLPKTSIITLKCNMNPLGDRSLFILAPYLANSEAKLKRLEISACRFNDEGFAQLLKVFPINKVLTYIRCDKH
eukprot:TRINITY_DN13796_c0_g1_i5.p3 TRINITY_DN13796_c0_g1~~TRINITY_DN13796_c0_g1_i5.p3  ORF type:complete len:109 (-),score=19.24 TRINITY_DN13796_c0_g1_i5:294-620(-)